MAGRGFRGCGKRPRLVRVTNSQTYTTCPGSRLLFPTLCKPPHPLHHRPSRPGRIGLIEQAQRDDLDVGLAGVAGEYGRGHAVSVAPSVR